MLVQLLSPVPRSHPERRVSINIESLYSAGMNSQYGSLGATFGYLPCKPAAAAVTATGRNMILATKAFVEDKYGGEVIYGDSVAAYTPIVTRRPSGEVEVLRIQDLNAAWVSDDRGKQVCVADPDFQVWTERGWTAVSCITRHLCSKPLYRVITRNGIVDVTQDHSLLTATGEPIRPTELLPGQRLLSGCPNLPGLLVCRVAIALATNVGSFCRDTGLPVPNFMLSASHSIKKAFWAAFCRDRPLPTMAVADMNQMAIARIYILAHAFGVQLEFDDRGNMSTSSADLSAYYADRGKVLSVRQLPPFRGFVYDLTTDNHHFQAGVGECIVHNTDSVFVKLPRHSHLDFAQLFEVGQEIATGATALFPRPVCLTFEKIYLPLLLYHKKHYSGMKFESSSDPGKRDVKGLACVRKDICPFMRRVMLQAIDDLLAFKNDAALDCVRSAALAMLNGQVDLADLVMSKQLGDEYATDSHPHVRVARLIEERNPGSGPQVGDRVSYVWVEVDDLKSRGFERAEDPGFVERSPDVQPDYLQYYEKQMLNQLKELVSNIIAGGNPFDTPEISSRLSSLSLARKQRDLVFKRLSNRQHAITSFFTRR